MGGAGCDDVFLPEWCSHGSSTGATGTTGKARRTVLLICGFKLSFPVEGLFQLADWGYRGPSFFL